MDGERTTTVALDVFEQEAIMRLQLQRFQATGRKPTLRELVSEGLSALLVQERLAPMHPAVPETQETTVERITKKLS